MAYFVNGEYNSHLQTLAIYKSEQQCHFCGVLLSIFMEILLYIVRLCSSN